jgi:hypothetical protein
MRCTQYILFFMFCGPGEHNGYSDQLWAEVWGLNPGVGEISCTSPDWTGAHPAFHTMGTEIFPRGKVGWAGPSWVKFNSYFFFMFDLFGGWDSMVSIATVPPAGWSWV